jgi:hypothetical protein
VLGCKSLPGSVAKVKELLPSRHHLCQVKARLDWQIDKLVIASYDHKFLQNGLEGGSYLNKRDDKVFKEPKDPLGEHLLTQSSLRCRIVYMPAMAWPRNPLTVPVLLTHVRLDDAKGTKKPGMLDPMICTPLTRIPSSTFLREKLSCLRMEMVHRMPDRKPRLVIHCIVYTTYGTTYT